MYMMYMGVYECIWVFMGHMGVCGCHPEICIYGKRGNGGPISSLCINIDVHTYRSTGPRGNEGPHKNTGAGRRKYRTPWARGPARKHRPPRETGPRQHACRSRQRQVCRHTIRPPVYMYICMHICIYTKRGNRAPISSLSIYTYIYVYMYVHLYLYKEKK